MTWNPGTSKGPIIATARSGPKTDPVRMREMEGAAASVVAMMLANRRQVRQYPQAATGPQNSPWTVRGRIRNTNRWFY